MRTISKRNGFKRGPIVGPKLDLGVNINDPYVGKSTEHKIKGQIQYGDLTPKYESEFVLKTGLTDINDIKAYIQEVLNKQDVYIALSGVSSDDFNSVYTDFMLDKLPQLTGQFTGDTFYFNFSSEHELSYNKETGIVTMRYNN